MARLFYTGGETGDFEWNGAYSTTGVSIPVVTAAAKRTGSYSIRLRGQGSTSGTPSYFRQVFSDNQTEIYGRFALYMDADTARETVRVVTLNDSSNGVQLELRYSQGTQCFNLRDGNTVLAYGNVIVPATTWVVCEFYANISASGQFTFKVNGTTDISYSGDTDYTNVGDVRSIYFYCQLYTNSVSNFFNLYLDDIGINNTTGSYETSWVGLGGVFYLEPTADGDQNDWTPSSGTVNYAMVDDIPPDGATTFNQALATNSIDLYEVDDCPQYIDEINCVQVCYRAALATSGYNELTDLVKVSGTVYSGTAHIIVPITPSFTYYLGTIHYLNPATGTVWGTAEVNAIQAGVEVTV